YLNEFCEVKGIKREYSNARTLQQNEVTERKNRTLIEEARTMLADLLLNITFWAETVNTACYVLNRDLVIKLYNKTPYELLNGRSPRLEFMRPIGYPVTILNTLYPFGKFKGKADKEFLVGKNKTLIEAARTMLADSFLPNTFWAEAVTTSCYVLNRPITAENKANKIRGPKEANNNAGASRSGRSSLLEELERLKRQEKEADDAAKTLKKMFAQSTEDFLLQARAAQASNTNYVNTTSTSVTTASIPVNTASPLTNVSAAGPSYPDLSTYDNQDASQIPSLEDIYEVSSDGIFTSASSKDEDAVADFTNLESTVNVSPITQSRIHFIHPTTQIL
nr:putative ribonuclease H-like domain-containing protein [Tanacetum cinerariifolium]